MFMILRSQIIILYAIIMMWILLDIHLQSVLRRKHFIVLFIILILSSNIILPNIIGRELYGKLIFFILHLPTIILFMMISKYRNIKLIFVFLTALVFCAVPIIIINSVMPYYFPKNELIQLTAYVLGCTVVLYIMNRFFKPNFVYMLQYGSNVDFYNFSFIPLLCCIYFFVSNQNSFTIHESPYNILIKIPVIITLFTYFLLVFIFKRTREIQILMNEKKLVEMQMETSKLSLENMRISQEQTAIYRHDLRHHISFTKSLLDQNEVIEAKDYLSQLQSEIDSLIIIRFCENETANLILTSFINKAKEKGISISSEITIPTILSLPDIELCTLLSNGLENAMNAVTNLKDNSRKTISLDCRVTDGNLLICIQNSFHGNISIVNDLPVVTEDMHGFGTKSMAAIAAKHGGYCQCEAIDSRFILRLMIPLS